MYRRTGNLWEGRYHACVVEGDANVAAARRYIDLNPMNARMVRHPIA
jgi:putative transposase